MLTKCSTSLPAEAPPAEAPPATCKAKEKKGERVRVGPCDRGGQRKTPRPGAAGHDHTPRRAPRRTRHTTSRCPRARKPYCNSESSDRGLETEIITRGPTGKTSSADCVGCGCGSCLCGGRSARDPHPQSIAQSTTGGRTKSSSTSKPPSHWLPGHCSLGSSSGSSGPWCDEWGEAFGSNPSSSGWLCSGERGSGTGMACP